MRSSLLFGGRSAGRIVRIGDTVHRPPGSRTDFTRAVLLLLEERGFWHAPRYLGIDSDGREMLSYLEGTVPHEQIAWTPAQLEKVAELLRALHDATAGSALAGRLEVVCHNDLAPWNTVLLEDVPVAFIDFDEAAPGARVDDLAYALWTFLGLGSDVSVETQIEGIRTFRSAYGLAGGIDIVSAVETQQNRVLRMRDELATNASDPEAREFSKRAAIRIRAEMKWVRRHRATMREALRDA